MKRSIYIGLFLSVIIILFSSCLDSDDSRAQYVGICTVHQLGESDHYFTLDDGVSLYPQNQGDLLSFELKDRERVILNFDYVDSKVDGYDHSIKVAYIEKILTKDIITITPEMEDSIGNDQINITSYRLTKEYLTLEKYDELKNSDDLIYKALEISTILFDNQTDKGGAPYILHLLYIFCVSLSIMLSSKESRLYI